MSDGLPERSNRATVYKIIDYLLDNGLLFKGKVEGLEIYFEGLENIIEDAKREQKDKFIHYLEYLDSIYEFPDEKDVIRRTIDELK